MTDGCSVTVACQYVKNPCLWTPRTRVVQVQILSSICYQLECFIFFVLFVMTYTDFLKSHFGEDGSLARVLQELQKANEETGLCYFYHYDVASQEIKYKYFSDDDNFFYLIWVRKLQYNLYEQPPETQRKIALRLGWRE